MGKAHFAADETPSEDPCTLGFDVNIAGHCAGAPGSYQGTKNFAHKGGSIVDVPGLEKYHGRDINLTDALTIEAKAQLDAAVAQKKPFYLYMSHYAVHGPWEPDQDSEPRERAGALLVGATIRHLAETGLADSSHGFVTSASRSTQQPNQVSHTSRLQCQLGR